MKPIIVTFAFLFIAACGGKSTPAPAPTPSTTEPAAGTPTTAEECEAAGYQVVGDIGDGQVKCPDGQDEISRIQYGIEGGVCCKPPAAE